MGPAGSDSVTWVVGTLKTVGTTATCDNGAVSGTTSQMSSLPISDVQGNGSCFDFGKNRGSISPDGKTVSLEIYTTSSISGDTCADGAVGAHTVTLNGTPFTGNAAQVYRIQ